MSFLWALAGFFLILTPIILIHELGHFTAARLSKIRVEEFGFGFPPRAAVLGQRNGTTFTLNWLPLGGFVRPAGEDDPTIPDGLSAASKRARFFVLAAGALANFVAAFLAWWFAFSIGAPAIAISYVNPDSPAFLGGIRTGDVILEVDGQKADNTNVISEPMYAKGGEPVELLVKRDGETMTLTVVPRLEGEYDSAVEGPIGVGLTMADSGERITRGFGEAANDAANTFREQVSLFFQVPVMLIRGDLSPSEARPVSVVGISQIAGQVTESSVSHNTVFPLLHFFAFINVALGLTNLLPIPALDGGRILFVLIEAIRGRRIEPEREGMVHVIGMLVLLSLMLFMIVQDIINPIIPF
ncbi:MAG: site-2 protease family protein [Chloroflexi bacterium]|nr:site-2 protease family protein [Chloroflexota bacterium]MBP7044620.1 site-2 protease family protein [Chloroflexota bacterium]